MTVDLAAIPAPKASSRTFRLSGGWRFLPWYPLAVTLAISVFVIWLARTSDAGWLVPIVIAPAAVLSIVMARDAMGMRLSFADEGIVYRGLGYTVHAPWNRVTARSGPQGVTLFLAEPGVTFSGWLGPMFRVARSLAPLHGKVASLSMQAVPAYCFGQEAVMSALHDTAPARSALTWGQKNTD